MGKMVFDWNRAAILIAINKPKCVRAGLTNDWGNTSGIIYENGKIVSRSYTYLSSTWDKPEIEMDGERFECYKIESETPEWNYDTYWPYSARKILYNLGDTEDIIDKVIELNNKRKHLTQMLKDDKHGE